MIVCPQSVQHPRGSRCQRLPGQVVKMSSSDPERPQLLLVKVLANRGRLEAVTQQMGYHPQYLDSFLKTQHYLMHMDGPLPFDCRHYIAIMAAARHHCRYLVNLHVLQFLQAGGDPQWLRGLDYIPPKLRNLNEINKILAHRPWLITKEHIEKLLKISEWSWSLAELVHAVVLLAHCHALASFVFGCGCEQDEGLGGRGSLKALSPGTQCICEASNGCGQELLRVSRKRSLDSCMELDSLRERMQRIHVETEGREEMRLLQHDREEGLSPLADPDGEVTGATNLACYMQDPDFGYQDFARRDENQTQVFRVQVRFLLSRWAAAQAPLLSSAPGGEQTVMGVPVQPRSGAAAFAGELSPERGPAPLGLGRGRWSVTSVLKGPPVGKGQKHSEAG
ncbi:sestrin-3 isoform X2 [Dryobates pubescens]|uniref:sestrin-3 isoform X2 n=1 Tax=Dryobates pubescens TaxID=118200 RepID=UPI0023B9A532|nr:sestrin-3 isoform X2 [Dryobates pubescens]